ncbi:cytochrome c oxidase assembly factor 3 homolog%2C mitochondrial [Scomber scombrus]|uniref:Cytochrome c oxidase assembly factor 3 n=1 Tax=Scomber scombrus TaxID=13677 RepID=A0AAV1NBK7_SCOSC
MADKTPKESDAPFAKRIDPTKEGLSHQQLHYIKQAEMQQWKKRTQKLTTRNALTGLFIGAAVLDGYTFYSFSQERIMEELDEEAKRTRMQGPKTGAN